MPKFMYTVIAAVLIAWYILFSFIRNTPPESAYSIIIFLGITFCALLLTISIPAYFVLQYKAPTFSNLRFLYRKSLRWSAFYSFGLTFLMALRAFALDNVVNVLLFAVFYFFLLLQVNSGR